MIKTKTNNQTDQLRLLRVPNMSRDFFENSYLRQFREAYTTDDLDNIHGIALKGMHLHGDVDELYQQLQWRKNPLTGYSYNMATIDDTLICDTIAHRRVPCEYFATYKGDTLVGVISCKLIMDARLLLVGGNVGYSILPQFRGKGYGKEQLRLCIEEIKMAHRGKLNSLIIDCANKHSEGVVRANGGLFLHAIQAEEDYDKPALELKRYVIFLNLNYNND